MAIRSWMAVACLACAGVLCAQSSVPISGNVADDRAHYFLLDVDQGSPAGPVDVTVSLTGGAASGLIVSLYDLDEWAALGPNYFNQSLLFGPGSLNVVLTLPSRTGVHQVLVWIETSGSGPTQPYTGSASVNAGTVAQAGFEEHPVTFIASRNVLGRYIPCILPLTGTSMTWVDVTLDFGPGGTSADLYVMVFTQTAGQKYRLLNLSASPPAEIFSVDAVSGHVLDEQSFNLGPHTGQVTFRIEITKNGSDGFASAEIVVGPGVTLANVAVVNPSGASAGSPKSSDCAVSPGAPASVGVALLAAWAAGRRRRGLRLVPTATVRNSPRGE